jgi:methyl-accepting chemotaxis protein
MIKGLGYSLNWKLQIIFNAIAVAAVLVISVGGYSASSQFAEKLGDAQAKEYLEGLALQAVILGVAVNAGVGAFAFFMARKITKPITKVTEVATKISQGDLTVTFEESKSNDEIGRLVNAQNKMITNLKDMISQVHTAAQSVSAGSQQIAASGNELGSAVQQIASTVDQISRGSVSQAQGLSKSKQIVEDLSVTINQLAKDTIESVEITQKVGSLSERGSESAKEAGERMNNIIKVTNESAQKVKGLAEKTSEITAVLDVIKQIADQTNLLALNAAIEAARAGEAGRGFAVVADEVRRLAESSSKSSEEIDSKLKQIHGDAQVVVEGIELSANEVNQGKMVIESSLKTLDEIATQVRSISNNVKRLSDSTQEEVAKVKLVSTSASEIAAVAEQNASSTEEAAAAVEQQTAQTHEIANAANQMSQLANQLESLISRFKLDVVTEPKTENSKENILTKLVQK